MESRGSVEAAGPADAHCRGSQVGPGMDAPVAEAGERLETPTRGALRGTVRPRTMMCSESLFVTHGSHSGGVDAGS